MNRVKELRMKAGMQQKELAIALGVAQPSVSAWERQKTDPTDENVVKLAEMFGVDESYIVYYSPSQILETPNGITNTVTRPLSNLTDEDLRRIANILQPHPEAPRTVEAQIVSFGMDKLPKEDRERLLAMIRALYSNRPELFNSTKGEPDDSGL